MYIGTELDISPFYIKSLVNLIKQH